jgi:hypothetical protein
MMVKNLTKYVITDASCTLTGGEVALAPSVVMPGQTAKFLVSSAYSKISQSTLLNSLF